MSEKNISYTSAPQEEALQKLALLVGVYDGAGDKRPCQEHLTELGLLAETLGIDVLEKVACPIRRIDVSTYLGSGKVEEIVEVAHNLGATLVIFDDEILPSQQRNLEKLFKLPVIDRTEVILEVFAQRAKTREARLQIELAQVRYQFPRLKRLWTHLSRQRGGGVNLKGEGETQIEIDRRLLKKRIERLQSDLKKVQEARQLQRHSREKNEVPTFAIVGYTNAGKSTLLKALTKADVLVEDKLFATLDTTTRRFMLPNNQDILLIDTVGFIRKLPHLLVAAFRSTLEEAVAADILIHLIDASHPNALEQAEATFAVLKELNAEDKPMITVLNKIDKVENRGLIDMMRIRYPKTVPISAKTGEGFNQLIELMEQEIANRRIQLKLRIPQSEYALISELIRFGKIHHKDYIDNDIVMNIEIPTVMKKKVLPYVLE